MEKKPSRFLFSFIGGILIPLGVLLALAPWSTSLDLETSRFFYQENAFSTLPVWQWIYVYGLWPAWGLIFLAGCAFAASFSRSFRAWQRPALFVLLTAAIGSGLLIHGTLKDHWGRPRPRQVIEFGGSQPFRPYYQPNLTGQPEPSKSFTCGHCSMGFLFFTLAILGLYYGSRRLVWLGWTLAWGLGILLSAGRIAQGGHFLTDTLASAFIMWATAWCLFHLLLKKEGAHERADT
jgi:membrane-associated PAP2 superfamily phosphatase